MNHKAKHNLTCKI